MTELTHTDGRGKAKMVDVGGKPDQERRAVASGLILLGAHTVKLIRENEMKKGDVLAIAQIAGIQAAKQTPSLIPLCHNIFLSAVNVRAEIRDNGVEVTAEATSQGKTGVEMEALTAVSVALLTVYDMCKAVDKEMKMEDIKLLSKEKR
jgi:cyclic pyranopterin phosphate synthase